MMRQAAADEEAELLVLKPAAPLRQHQLYELLLPVFTGDVRPPFNLGLRAPL